MEKFPFLEIANSQGQRKWDWLLPSSGCGAFWKSTILMPDVMKFMFVENCCSPRATPQPLGWAQQLMGESRAGSRPFPPLPSSGRWHCRWRRPGSLLQRWVLVVLTASSYLALWFSFGCQYTVSFSLNAMSSCCITSRNLDPVYIYNEQPRNK